VVSVPSVAPKSNNENPQKPTTRRSGLSFVSRIGCSCAQTMTSPPAGNTQPRVGAENLTADTLSAFGGLVSRIDSVLTRKAFFKRLRRSPSALSAFSAVKQNLCLSAVGGLISEICGSISFIFSLWSLCPLWQRSFYPPLLSFTLPRLSPFVLRSSSLLPKSRSAKKWSKKCTFWYIFAQNTFIFAKKTQKSAKKHSFLPSFLAQKQICPIKSLLSLLPATPIFKISLKISYFPTFFSFFCSLFPFAFFLLTFTSTLFPDN